MTKEEIKIIDFFKHVGINDKDALKQRCILRKKNILK